MLAVVSLTFGSELHVSVFGRNEHPPNLSIHPVSCLNCLTRPITVHYISNDCNTETSNVDKDLQTVGLAFHDNLIRFPFPLREN